MYMKLLTTTNARKKIKEIVNRARYRGEVFAIGRRNEIDAVLIGFPQAYNDSLSDITNVNAYSKSFDFLAKEPDIYSIADLKRRYV
jgi:ribosome-interacting GTPase 1